MSQSAAVSLPEPPIHPWVTAVQGGHRFGIAYGPFSDWPACRDWVQLIEGLGFDSFWLPDHPVRNADPWTTLAALAVTTRTIRLGLLTACVAYRPPLMLARLAADVDRLSSGRLILGLGIGDYAREFEQLGLPCPSVAQRQAQLAATVQILRAAWGEPVAAGPAGALAPPAVERLRPGPVQRPRVPLLIAGGGERVTLRQVAQYADLSNMAAHVWTGGAFSTDDLRRKYAALQRHCLTLGRPYGAILRSHLALPLVLANSPTALQRKLNRLPSHLLHFWQTSLVAGTPAQVITHYRGLSAAGVQYFIAGFLRGELEGDEETVRLLAREVVPALVASAPAAGADDQP